MHVIVDCSVADPGEAHEGPAPLIFRPNWGPKGRKNVFWRPRPPRPPFLRVWITGPPPLMSDARQLEVSSFSLFKILLNKYY